MSAFVNTLQSQVAKNALCKAFGVRLVTNTSVIQLASNSGFDAIFVDLEHSTLSIDDASALSTAALNVGLTPLVRVPHQCGNGFVQRILDGGAMGVVFPHIHTRAEAEAAVSISKYPPQGCRSMTGQLPVFNLRSTPAQTIIEQSNARYSTVVLMIETKESIERVEEIASVDGVEVLLIGSNDLSIELDIPGQFQDPVFRSALQKVSLACQRYGKVFGLAGIYDSPEIQSWAINDLRCRFILGQQDSGLIAGGGKKCADTLSSLLKPE